MRLNDDAIAEIADLLTSTRSVPMPGGHGYLFPDLRKRHPGFSLRPSVPERCAVVIRMLGLGATYGKFLRKGWMPFAELWFDRHASPELIVKVGRSRWQHLLQAMAINAQTVVPKFELEASVEEARIKIDGYLRTRRRGARNSSERLGQSTRKVPLPAIRYQPQLDVESATRRAWVLAVEALTGPSADHALMLYTMHALHSSLGVPQYSMDSHHDSRETFYRRLAEMMNGLNSEEGCGICRLAPRVAAALRSTRACGAAPGQAGRLRFLEATLPACFQPAHRYSVPPLRSKLYRRLADQPGELALLMDAHDLAEALADRIIDPLWLTFGRDSERMKLTHYDLMLATIRYGDDTYQQALQAQVLPPDDETGDDCTPVCESRDVFEHIGNLAAAAKDAAGILRDCSRWRTLLDDERCSLCLKSACGQEVTQ